MNRRKTDGLFFKAMLALGLVSLVPVLLIGWHMLRVNSHVLQDEILDKQQREARRIAFLISEETSRKVQLLSVFVSLHTNIGDHPALNQADIEFLRKKNPSISYITVLGKDGKQILFSGEEKDRALYQSVLNNVLQKCISEQATYLGAIQRADGNLYAVMGFPLITLGQEPTPSRVLIAEVGLGDLWQLLEKSVPADMNVAVATKEGLVIFSSASQSARTKDANTAFSKQVDAILQQLNGNRNGQVRLKDGKTILVSTDLISSFNWVVLVSRPADTWNKLVTESSLHSLMDVLFIVLAVILFIIGVGYWVLKPIIQPVQRLQTIALKLEKEDNYLPTEKDFIIPNNEIGDLARVFLQMAQVLAERKKAMKAAQEELDALNKQLELRVQQRTAELETATEELVKAEQLAAIGQMASIISHEIRNPLAVISNAARLIKVIQPPTDPKLIKQFSIIDAEIRQANSIIGEVLGFARSREMILSTIDLNSYVHELIVSFPTSHNVRIEEELDPESVRLKVDAEEMKQALRNLISNAAEAMPQGGTITVGTKVGKKMVCIYVGDEGPGISEDLLEKIFSPFYTTKARGTGLGLAVVRKAVKRHKGKLFVHNLKQPGKGAIFEIYLKIYTKVGDTRYDG